MKKCLMAVLIILMMLVSTISLGLDSGSLLYKTTSDFDAYDDDQALFWVAGEDVCVMVKNYSTDTASLVFTISTSGTVDIIELTKCGDYSCDVDTIALDSGSALLFTSNAEFSSNLSESLFTDYPFVESDDMVGELLSSVVNNEASGLIDDDSLDLLYAADFVWNDLFDTDDDNHTSHIYVYPKDWDYSECST